MFSVLLKKKIGHCCY